MVRPAVTYLMSAINHHKFIDHALKDQCLGYFTGYIHSFNITQFNVIISNLISFFFSSFSSHSRILTNWSVQLAWYLYRYVDIQLYVYTCVYFCISRHGRLLLQEVTPHFSANKRSTCYLFLLSMIIECKNRYTNVDLILTIIWISYSIFCTAF